jgi:predicted transcriptional regulator
VKEREKCMDVEEFFSSKLRMKIIKLFLQIGELNVSEVARRLGVNYKTIVKHLKVLEEEGILQHKTFGRIHLYRINEKVPKTKVLQKLVEVWEHSNK